MVNPLHVGLEHPSLVWLGITALLAFIAGLCINLYQSSTNLHQQPDSDENADR